jgi:hypothetical protein
MDYRDSPQHRVPHHIKWSGFAPPKRSNFTPPLNRTGARDQGVEPVHSNTNLTVKKQTKDRALAETYMLYIPVNSATLNVPEMSRKNTLITGTGRYLFDLLKGDDGVWRICEYWITMKQSAV